MHIDKQLINYENNSVFKRATSLDPRLKMSWCSTSESISCSDIAGIVPCSVIGDQIKDTSRTKYYYMETDPENNHAS